MTSTSLPNLLFPALIAIVLAVLPFAGSAVAGSTESQEYVANGFVTVFCEGENEDLYLNEPWCLPLNVLHNGEESVIGGAEWDVADSLGRDATYTIKDDLGSSTHTILGIGDHVGIEDHVEGCGTLHYTIPEDATGDEIDEGVHLVAQISILHTTDDLDLCLGSTGIASLDILP